MKSDRINTWPSRARPRERLIAEGPDHLTDAELLAIILRVGRGTFKTGVRGDTAVTLARSLLADFQGLSGLDRADRRDLLKFPGVSIATTRILTDTLCSLLLTEEWSAGVSGP